MVNFAYISSSPCWRWIYLPDVRLSHPHNIFVTASSEQWSDEVIMRNLLHAELILDCVLTGLPAVFLPPPLLSCLST